MTDQTNEDLNTASNLAAKHSRKHWKDLFSLAIPRWSIYGAKVLTGALLTAVSLPVLGIGVVVGAWDVARRDVT